MKPIYEKVDSFGVTYFDDINCLWKKHHTDGLMNIYSVVVYFCRTHNGKETNTAVRSIFTYGDFKTAFKRYAKEIDLCRNGGHSAIEVSMHMTTYNGVEPVLEEDLLSGGSEEYI